MRIVYALRDQDWDRTKSLGIVNVSLRILHGLAAAPEVGRIDVLANRSLAPQLRALATRDTCRLHFLDQPAPRRWRRLWWDNWSLARVCNRLAPDWLLLPKGFGPLLRWPRARVSAYVHDNIFAYYERRGERPYPAGEAALFPRMFHRVAARADCIVSNSAFTAGQFQQAYRPAKPVVRIGAPVEPAASGAIAPDGSLLLATSEWPHKLTRQAIAWTERWTTEHDFTGQVHGFGTLPRDGGWPARRGWRHHGRIDDARLAELEARAAVLLYFSDYEGYGLPPVEAAAAGRRTVASDLPPLRETLPPAALFRNDDYRSFDRALTAALAGPPLPPLRIDTGRDVAARWLSELQRNG